jgi:hypothetical protein
MRSPRIEYVNQPEEETKQHPVMQKTQAFFHMALKQKSPVNSITAIRSEKQKIAIQLIENLRKLISRSKNHLIVLGGEDKASQFINNLLAGISTAKQLSHKHNYSERIQQKINQSMGKLFDNYALKFFYVEEETHVIETLKQHKLDIMTTINAIDVTTKTHSLGESNKYFQTKEYITEPQSSLTEKTDAIKQKIKTIIDLFTTPEPEKAKIFKHIQTKTPILTKCQNIIEEIDKVHETKSISTLNLVKRLIKDLFKHCGQPHKYITDYKNELASLLKKINTPAFTQAEKKYIKQLTSPTTNSRKTVQSEAIRGYNSPYI